MISPALHGRLTNASSQYFRYWFLFWHFVDGFLPIRFTSGWSHSDDPFYTDEWKSHSSRQIQRFFLLQVMTSLMFVCHWVTDGEKNFWIIWRRKTILSSIKYYFRCRKAEIIHDICRRHCLWSKNFMWSNFDWHDNFACHVNQNCSMWQTILHHLTKLLVI